MDEKELMEKMGLPTSFNGRSARSSNKKRKKREKDESSSNTNQMEENQTTPRNRRIVFKEFYHQNNNNQNLQGGEEMDESEEPKGREIQNPQHNLTLQHYHNITKEGSYYNQFQEQNEEENQNQDHTDNGEDVINRFWNRRYQLFSLFDHGIKLDVG